MPQKVDLSSRVNKQTSIDLYVPDLIVRVVNRVVKVKVVVMDAFGGLIVEDWEASDFALNQPPRLSEIRVSRSKITITPTTAFVLDS